MKKNTTQRKKLTLHRTTLRQLRRDALAAIAAGTTTTYDCILVPTAREIC